MSVNNAGWWFPRFSELIKKASTDLEGHPQKIRGLNAQKYQSLMNKKPPIHASTLALPLYPPRFLPRRSPSICPQRRKLQIKQPHTKLSGHSAVRGFNRMQVCRNSDLSSPQARRGDDGARRVHVGPARALGLACGPNR
jgi:hypothetical protein